MMLFSEINVNKDGCCLVCHEETVYKVKVIFGEEVRKCDSAKLRLELEQVFRAVLHLSRSDEHIPPIFTQHLMVKPVKIYWTISEKIGFQQNGKDLETSSYFFQFHVSERPVWKPTQNKVPSGRNPISTRDSPKAVCSSLASGRSGKLQENEDSVRNLTVKLTSRKVNAAEQTSCSRKEASGASGRNVRIEPEPEEEEKNGSGREEEGKDEKTMEERKRDRASTSSSDSDIDDQQENRRSLRSSVRLKASSLNTKKQIGRSAVTELSQSGVTDLDITCGTDSVSTNQQDGRRKKRKSYGNVDDITGFSYKLNRFRAKISSGDSQSGKKGHHVLYRAGGCGRGNVHSPLKELPVVSSSGGTAETVDKTKGYEQSSTHKTSLQLNNSTDQRQGLPSLSNTDKCTRPIAKERVCTIPEDVNETGQSSGHLIPRMNHDLTADSHQHSTCTTSTRSQTFRDEFQKRTMPYSDGSKSLTGSPLKGPLTRQSVSPKTQRLHTRSAGLSEGRKSASPAKSVKIVTRSDASSKSLRGQMRSATPLKGHRGRMRSATPLRGHRGRLRSATPLKGHRGRTRSETPSKDHRRQMRSITQCNGGRGRMRSETPSKGQRGQTTTLTPSKGHIDQRMSASPSKSSRRQLRSTAASVESERLLRMQQPIQHGIQLTDVDRYLVEQEELQEVSKLQEMAATHDQQSCHYTRSQRKRSNSGLWNFVDSLIITPAKKIFKRM